jgi:hypothetical protein
VAATNLGTVLFQALIFPEFIFPDFPIFLFFAIFHFLRTAEFASTARASQISDNYSLARSFGGL